MRLTAKNHLARSTNFQIQEFLIRRIALSIVFFQSSVNCGFQFQYLRCLKLYLETNGMAVIVVFLK